MSGTAEMRRGRPRSEDARVAVLHAVDDLLVEHGYAAMTMSGIAERAGVGRQTLYRWWSTKAEILMEASAEDARAELSLPAHTPPDTAGRELLAAFLRRLETFLTTSDAGLAYRALLGEAQHDPTVARLLADHEPLRPAAAAVLERVRPTAPRMPVTTVAADLLIGPLVFRVLTAPSQRDDAFVDASTGILWEAWRA